MCVCDCLVGRGRSGELESKECKRRDKGDRKGKERRKIKGVGRQVEINVVF